MNRRRRTVLVSWLAAATAVVAPGAWAASDDAKLLKMEWNDILKEARGQTVRFWMWAGDAGVNQYIDEWVAPRVKALYGIELKRVPIKETAEGVAISRCSPTTARR
jgi:putative spermidine/putrescine transport system substrate-binding protein